MQTRSLAQLRALIPDVKGIFPTAAFFSNSFQFLPTGSADNRHFPKEDVHMKCENTKSPVRQGFAPRAEPQNEEHRPAFRGDNRSHPRFAYPVRTSVELPSLRTKEYGLCDFSRSGMFLAFTDVRATRLTLERNRIEPGTDLVVRFTVSLPDATHCCRVQARLARITTHGIGIRFTPRNPWQIAALADLLSRARENAEPSD
jgi:hypothetical protein